MRCFCFFVGASSLEVFFPPLVELAPADAFAFLDFGSCACGADEATSDGVIETVRERCCAMIDGSGAPLRPEGAEAAWTEGLTVADLGGRAGLEPAAEFSDERA